MNIPWPCSKFSVILHLFVACLKITGYGQRTLVKEAKKIYLYSGYLQNF